MRKDGLIKLLTVAVLIVSLIPTDGATAVQMEETPVPLPRGCRGLFPLSEDPPACCLSGYIYHDDEPLAGVDVHVESAHGTLDTVTASGEVSSEPYYGVDLSNAPLLAATGDVITITASYNGMVSSRTWTVQGDGQQVDLGLLAGYQAPDVAPPQADDALDTASLESSDWLTSVQEDIQQSEYHVTWQDQTYLADLPAAYQAPNRAHNLRTYFAAEGIRVIPRTPPLNPPRERGGRPGGPGGAWEWDLTFTGYGRDGDTQPVGTATIAVDGNRVEYDRGAGLTEWYVNDERGLEQGFTLAAAPKSQISNPQTSIALELALTGDLTPNLTEDGDAIEFTTAGGVRVLHYGELYAMDATGRELAAQFELRGAQIAILVDDTDAVYPVTVDPLATTPNWTAESNQADANFGISAGTAGDVNGDGFSDVIIGAHTYDGGQMDEGRAFVYYGSASGLSVAADWVVEGNQADAKLGNAVGTAGDVNGDGYADVVIGANDYNNGSSYGRVYVYHGSAIGLDTTPSWMVEGDQATSHLGSAVGTAGDVNGDDYADIIISAARYDGGQTDEGRIYVYTGSATGLATTIHWTVEGNQSYAYFGSAVGTAGDVNGDGYADVIVGAHIYDSGQYDEGKVFVYYGSSSGLTTTTADWTAESNEAESRFGYAAGTAGDVNGDGYADVIVGAYGYGDGQTGRVYVYTGTVSGLSASADWIVDSDQLNSRLGRAVGTAGDVNGDGYADVIVGAHTYSNGQTEEGRAYVYYGSEKGLDQVADWVAESDQADAYFGIQTGTAGDVNGDGYADVIVGASIYDNGQADEGRVFLYYGGPDNLSTTADWTAEGDQDGAHFGRAVDTAGDVNGDGYADAIVGAPYYDNGQVDEGKVFVYHGSAVGLSAAPDWVAESNQSGARLGEALSAAGDVNGDGYADIIVAAYFFSSGQAEEGKVFVWYGSGSGLGENGIPTNADWTAEGDQASARFGRSVATAGDVNGDGYSDIIVGANFFNSGQTEEGKVFTWYGSDTGLGDTGTPDNADWAVEGDQVGIRLGTVVATAGDVNGDGYADVIVGAQDFANGHACEGKAFVYHGSDTGLGSTATWTAEGNQYHAYFGSSVGTAGDVNGDGYADIVVGAHAYDNDQYDEGKVFVYYGSADGVSTAADWTSEGDQSQAYFGIVASTAGDVNGDGYADVIIGAAGYDNGQDDEGKAFVYYGSQEGLSDAADWEVESDQAGATLGHWVKGVGTAGDVNGDGYADIIVGARAYDNGQIDEGRVFLYYGNGSDGLHLLPRQMRSDGVTPIAPGGLSDSATSVKLSLIGRMPLGRERVKMEYQVAPLGTPFDAATGVVSGTSAAWTDVLTTGVAITETVTGLTPGTAYHWRARLLYAPGNRLGQPASRWVHMPWNGWLETDFRTAGEALPTAAFGGSPLAGTVPLTVIFTDQSTGDVTDWLWDFGDGVTSTLQHPTHTYTLTGTYTVSLTISGPTGSDVETKVDYVTAGYAAPVATFTAAPLTGTVVLDVQFTDQSTGAITQWDWVFGDGGVSGARHPLHDYTTAGTFTVSLTVSGPSGSDTETKVGYISASFQPPVASVDFIAPDPAIQGQDTVYFSGSGQDGDEGGDYIAAYTWTSDLDGPLSTQREFTVQASALSTGTHTISFKVQDDEGEWSPEVTRTLTVEPPPAVVRTLILVNRQKLETLYGTSEADQVMGKLNDLALHTSVEGLVVQVENDPTVAAAYTLWDADPANTARANDVAEAIKALIDSYWSTSPDLEYLVIVGDDRAIPFYRAADGTRYPESHYGAVSPASTVGAALQDDMTLTDDFYGDELPVVLNTHGWHDHAFYVPDLGVGRLIETPTEIVAQIDAFLANDGVVADDAIVTGYQFLKDVAQEVCSELSADGLTTDCTLIGDAWNAAQFESAVLDTRHDLVSFNGHANHYIIGTPSGYISSGDVASAAADHTQALFFTPGCHSGLNVPPANPYQPLDTAQAMIQNKAVYVANTGYGWGYVFSVGLSEQIMLDFTERLVYGQSATVGQALTAAKREYYLTDRYFDAYDEKILLESTLYGLPMLRYATPAMPDAPQDAAVDVSVEGEMRVLDEGLTVNSLAYQFPALLAETTGEGQYYTLGDELHSSNTQPIQPKYVADLSFPGTNVHGIVFTGGTYTDVLSFNPVVDRAITETAALEPAFAEPGWYPALPHRLASLDDDGRLVTVLGQFNAQGQAERLYERQSFDVYYHVSSDDWTPPTILDMSSVLAGEKAFITVEAEDGSGIHTVVIAYTDGNGVWASTSLLKDSNAWSGSFPAGAETAFFIQVVDGAGNVAVDANDGLYFSPGDGASVIYLPLVLKLP